MRLSIVIATYNRGACLVRALESLARMDLEPAQWEAVVVDNNCTDDTRELFGRFAHEHAAFNFRIVGEMQQGLSPARNRGIAESRGEIVAFIDDDEEVNEGFGRAYLDFFDSYPSVCAAGGKYIPHYEFRLPRWVSPLAERPISNPLDLGEVTRPFPARRLPGGGNMALRRSAVERYGVFDPALGRTGAKLLAGEEKDLLRRMQAAGEEVWYVPGAQILHIIPRERMTLKYLARVSRMVGVSERIRTSRSPGRLMEECLKWGVISMMSLFYLLTLRPAKAWGLLVLRWNITAGLLCRG